MKKSAIIFLSCASALAGLSSCSAVEDENYGTPHAEFEIKGLVSDEQGAPLQGIAVIYDEDLIKSDTLYTGPDGRFLIEGTMFPREEMKLKFKDVDGDQNGGLYEAKAVKVKMIQIQQSTGSWDYGKFAGETEVTLKKAE